MIAQYQASEYAVYDHPWPTSEQEIKDITGWFASGDGYLAVWLKTPPKLIGFVSLNRAEQDDVRQFDLGYVFNREYHGQGYAREACQALLDHAFRSLGADRITTGTAAANRPSRRLLEGLGMKVTGEATASFRQAEDGQPIEFLGLTFALDREDWLQRRRGGQEA
jgi:RimJ/RimL family protein N-acetyltransferase